MCRLQPSAAIYSAITSPMPFEAPVMRTDLPLRLMSIYRSLINLENFAGEGGAHDLGRSAGDQITARTPPHGFNRHFGGQAHRAMKLHAAVRRLEAEFSAENFCHVSVMTAGDAFVDL